MNVLGRRDPKLYGGWSLGELESRIYQWARDHNSSAQCKQTNDEGEYVNWIHEALDWADGVIVNPGAWTHYSYAIRGARAVGSCGRRAPRAKRGAPPGSCAPPPPPAARKGPRAKKGGRPPLGRRR